VVAHGTQGFGGAGVFGAQRVQIRANAGAHKVAFAEVGTHVGAPVHVKCGVQQVAQSRTHVGHGFSVCVCRWQRIRCIRWQRIRCIQVRPNGRILYDGQMQFFNDGEVPV
jgi:hypothetical protein